MVSANQDKVAEVVVNPFTGILVFKPVGAGDSGKAQKSGRADEDRPADAGAVSGFAHNRVSLFLLPKFLFEQKEEGLKRLQQEEGALLLQFYDEVYPKGKKSGCRAEDFSLMTLNLTDTIQLTRLDMPDETNKKGLCYRVYAVFKRDTEEVLYYTMENTKDGNMIASVTQDGKHEILEPVPDNGAEIEAILNLVEPS